MLISTFSVPQSTLQSRWFTHLYIYTHTPMGSQRYLCGNHLINNKSKTEKNKNKLLEISFNCAGLELPLGGCPSSKHLVTYVTLSRGAHWVIWVLLLCLMLPRMTAGCYCELRACMLSVVMDNVMEENDLSLQTDTVLVKVSDQIFFFFFCQLH